jgi:hypothetical protein
VLPAGLPSLPSLPSAASMDKGTPRRELSFDPVKLGGQYKSPTHSTTPFTASKAQPHRAQPDQAAAPSTATWRTTTGRTGQRSRTAPRTRQPRTPRAGAAAAAAAHTAQDAAAAAAAGLRDLQLSPPSRLDVMTTPRRQGATPGADQRTPDWHAQALLTLNDLHKTWDTVKKTPCRRTPGAQCAPLVWDEGAMAALLHSIVAFLDACRKPAAVPVPVNNMCAASLRRLCIPHKCARALCMACTAGALACLLPAPVQPVTRLAACAAARSRSAPRASPELPNMDTTTFDFNISRLPLNELPTPTGTPTANLTKSPPMPSPPLTRGRWVTCYGPTAAAARVLGDSRVGICCNTAAQ